MQMHTLSPKALLPSPTNPRRDLGDLTELTESIRLHGIIEPLIARPAARKGKFEIVCGHRRHAAVLRTGARTVPVLVRELDDAQVLDLQLAENMERSDLTAFEEAEAFALRVERGQTVEHIADRIGRSTSFVARRLRLRELHADVQEALRDEAISVSVAELLGRLPLELQADCVEDVAVEDRDRPYTVARAQELMARRLRRLDRAPFDVADATLHPSLGACTTCPMRSGNQGSLFDADEDYCLDAVCYRDKCTAMAQRAERAGRTVLHGDAAKKALSWGGGYTRWDKQVWIQPDDEDAADSDDDENRAYQREVRALLTEQGADVLPVLAVHPETGEVAELVPVHVVDAAVDRAEGREPRAAPTRAEASAEASGFEAKRKAREKLRRRALDAYIQQAVEHAEVVAPEDLLGLLVRALARQTEHTNVLRLLRRRGIETDDARADLARLAASVTLGDGLEQLAVELVLLNAVPWSVARGEDEDEDDEGEFWADAQRVVEGLGLPTLTLKGIEKELSKADRAKAKKAKKAKRGGGE